MDEIVNRVEGSGLVTIDLEELYPQGERVVFDIADYLWERIALKEKDFRQALKEIDWSEYKGKYVAILCSVDAIVPTWAYMLVAQYLEPEVEELVFGSLSELESLIFKKKLASIDLTSYKNARVVVKGCGEKEVPVSTYVELTRLLRPVVKSLMFGEPCSTVPVYKKTKQA